MSTQTFNVSFPKEMIDEIDKYAKQAYQNRSEFLRNAARIRLKEMKEWEELFAYGKKMGKKAGIKSEEDVYRIMEEFRHGKKSS